MKDRHMVVLIVMFAILMLSCGGSKISYTPGRPVDHPVNTIALAPSGGLLADEIGMELFNRGYFVVDTSQMTALMARLDMSELEILQPTSLTSLQAEGVDVILSCRAAAGYDGKPQSASVRLTSVATGAIVAGLSWQNGWGGQAGSMADRVQRKDLTEAAAEISKELAKNLPAPGTP